MIEKDRKEASLVSGKGVSSFPEWFSLPSYWSPSLSLYLLLYYLDILLKSSFSCVFNLSPLTSSLQPLAAPIYQILASAHSYFFT